jgi:SAM-dependent methyltransferase
VRRFDADYLRRTRAGLWPPDDRGALAALSLADRERVLDVGCGTGELTRVLAEESPPGATVVGVDADPSLLATARAVAPVAAGDATRLPVADGAVDLAVCQALLVNLPDPAADAAVRELRRVSTDRVGAIEPDNGDVGVESTVADEAAVEARARRAFLAGVATDVAPGERTAERLRAAGLAGVTTRRHHHVRRTEPPYDDAAVADAARTAAGGWLDDHEPTLRRALSDAAYDALRADWRAVGRAAVDQIRAGEYRKVEVVPYDVTAGRV